MGQRFVVMVNCEKDGNQNGNQGNNDPGTIFELGNCENDHDDESADCTKAVDDHFEFPAFIVDHG